MLTSQPFPWISGVPIMAPAVASVGSLPASSPAPRVEFVSAPGVETPHTPVAPPTTVPSTMVPTTDAVCLTSTATATPAVSAPGSNYPTPLIASASLLSQLPQIPRFTGDNQPEGETFGDWLEQFESVAALGRWDDHCKLVNLTSRLRGTAYSFYRSCTAEH